MTKNEAINELKEAICCCASGEIKEIQQSRAIGTSKGLPHCMASGEKLDRERKEKI